MKSTRSSQLNQETTPELYQNNNHVRKNDIKATQMESQFSPSALPPPPPAPPIQAPSPIHQLFTEMSMSPSCLPTPPPLPPHTTQSVANNNNTSHYAKSTNTSFNTFGRSNTLDRKSFATKTSFKMADKNDNSSIYQNYNSLERKTITDSDNHNASYRLFNTLNKSGSLQQQRNSLNLALKPPSPNGPATQRQSPNSNDVYVKRPLSQDTILENSACLLEFQQKMQSTPTSPDHYSIAFNHLQQQQQHSPGHLKQELDIARNQILILTNQLNKSVQVISSLEQSVSCINTKLHKVSQSSKRKENIISELKAYIDMVHRKHGKLFEADVSTASQLAYNNIYGTINRHNSAESLNSLSSSMFSQQTHATASFLNNSGSSTSYSNEASACHLNQASEDLSKASPSKKKNWLRSSFRRAFNRKNCPTDETKVDSNASNSPNKSSAKCLSDVDENDLIKSRMSEFELDNHHLSHLKNEYSLPSSPMHNYAHLKSSKRLPPRYPPQTPFAIGLEDHQQSSDTRQDQIGNLDLQSLLREKEAKLTDIRLEALATAHQLDSQKEENLRLRNEIEQLRLDQLKLQTFLGTQAKLSPTSNNQSASICSSLSSPSPSSSIASSSNSKLNLSLSTNHMDTHSASLSLLTPRSTNKQAQLQLKSPVQGHLDPTTNRDSNYPSLTSHKKSADTPHVDGKRVCVTIYLGDSDPLQDAHENNQVFIGSLSIGTRTNWETLDTLIKDVFKSYIDRLDGNGVPPLGLNLNSIAAYYVGEMPRESTSGANSRPDLLPYGYLVGDHTTVVIKLRTVTAQYQNDIDMLCYETLVQKSRMQCYISLVLDYRNLIFCGPNGACKSYLARKLGEFLARREDRDVESSVAYFNAENKTSKEVKRFLGSIAEHEDGSEVPMVLILDNLENIGNNLDVFQEFFTAKMNSQNKCSYVIGTINQTDVSSLNLHPSFKWILCANHTEPVRSYLNRHLQRRLIDFESKHNTYCQDLEKIVNWLPKAWLHINKYIEQYNSSDLALGPKIFSVVPLDFKQSLNWFIELWNNHLVPFMIETIKEGVQVYGTKMSWEDPKQWIAASFPWTTYDMSLLNSLYSIEPQHVGFDSDTESSGKMSSSNEDEDKIEKDFDDLDNLNNLNNNLDAQITLQNQRPVDSHQFVNNENDKLLNMLIRLQECTNGTSRPVSTLSGMPYADYDTSSVIINNPNA